MSLRASTPLALARYIPFYRYLPFGTPPIEAFLHPGDASWALVTGSSAGIGLALARELAIVYGFNVVLHGRDNEKLERVRQEILTEAIQRGRRGSRTEVRVIVADASNGPKLDYASFREALSDLKLTLLINNVSFASRSPETAWSSLVEAEEDDIAAVLQSNLMFTILLTRALLPLLKAHQPSHIVNISSHVSLLPLPFLTVYSTTKAAINAFSTSLSRELYLDPSTRQVTVQAVLVGSVVTPSNPDPPGLLRTTARSFARDCVRVMGDGTRIGPGSWRHAIEVGFLSWLPDSWILDGFLGTVARRFRVRWARMRDEGMWRKRR